MLSIKNVDFQVTSASATIFGVDVSEIVDLLHMNLTNTKSHVNLSLCRRSRTEELQPSINTGE